MKLLSLWEPWATLMAIGAKKIETRSWDTSYRGPLLIQSAKHFTADEDDLCFTSPFREALLGANVPLLPYRSGKRFSFPLGKIVAVVNLTGCVPTDKIFRQGTGNGGYDNAHKILTPEEEPFGDYSHGRYGWITEQLFRVPEPIPFKGRQGLIDVGINVIVQLREQGWRV